MQRRQHPGAHFNDFAVAYAALLCALAALQEDGTYVEYKRDEVEGETDQYLLCFAASAPTWLPCSML